MPNPHSTITRADLGDITLALSNHFGCVAPAAQVDFLDRLIAKDLPGWPGLLAYLEGCHAYLTFDNDLKDEGVDFEGEEAVS